MDEQELRIEARLAALEELVLDLYTAHVLNRDAPEEAASLLAGIWQGKAEQKNYPGLHPVESDLRTDMYAAEMRRFAALLVDRVRRGMTRNRC
ncbi:hypothetical protein [Ferrovibrio sp.]|uniref:hypothetical protein n=1 Tax=Ferrovibrio sp. TaxID=1917215 RepID=UPI00311F5DFA